MGTNTVSFIVSTPLARYVRSQTTRTRLCPCPWSTQNGPFVRRRQANAPSPPFTLRSERHRPLEMAIKRSLPAPVQEGCIVEFLTQSGGRRLGAAVRPDGKKNWIVEDESGSTHSVTPKQLAYVLGPGPSGGGPDAVSDELAATAARCEEQVAEHAELLELAWEVVLARAEDEGGPNASLTEITELIFDSAERDLLYAVHVMLARDRVYFKTKVIKGVPQFEAKSEKNVEDARAVLKAEVLREKDELLKRTAIVESVSSQSPDLVRDAFGDEMYGLMVGALEAIAEDLGGAVRDAEYTQNADAGYCSLDDQSRAAAKLVLGALRKAILPSHAFDVLVAWGVFTRHENLAFRRAGLANSLEFDASALHLADALLNTDAAQIEDLDAGRRRDLTAMVSYAIDSADTDEVDDALSWDAEEEVAWVHIADPTRFFASEYESEPLIVEALRRSMTLYLPSAKYTMFPSELATERFSLTGSKVDEAGPCALSFGFRLLDDGAIDIASAILTPSVIRSPERLTYEQADEILLAATESSPHPLCALQNVASRRCKFRIEDGAIDSNSPFSKVLVRNPEAEEPTITVSLSPTDGASWLLVSELMIAACSVAGEFGDQNNIPLMYRGQEGFEYPTDEALEEIPAGPARNSAIFKNAPPSQVVPEPVGHASLGLDAYVQVTSPIRRSGDLLAHLQLKAFLRGESLPLDLEKMTSEIARSMDGNRKMRSVDQSTTKYWHLEYLRRLGPQFTHEAIYVRPLRGGLDRRGLVYICESGFQTVADVPPGTEPGTRLAVKMTSVEPRKLFSRATATGWAEHEAKQVEARALKTELDALFSDIDSQDDE